MPVIYNLIIYYFINTKIQYLIQTIIIRVMKQNFAIFPQSSAKFKFIGNCKYDFVTTDCQNGQVLVKINFSFLFIG